MSVDYGDRRWQLNALVADHLGYASTAARPRRTLLALACADCAAPLQLRGRDDRDLLRAQFQAFDQGWRQRPDGSHVCPAHAVQPIEAG